MSWILGLHTTTSTLGLALIPTASDPASERWHYWPLGQAMAGQLHPILQTFLEPHHWSDIQGVGVAVGPGSFTGCRLGVTVARTLGQSLQIPVYGFSSLAAIAYTEFQSQPSLVEVAIELDARRDQWYGGLYNRRSAVDPFPETLVQDQLWTSQNWEQLLQSRDHPWRIDADDYAEKPPVRAIGALAAAQYQAGHYPKWSQITPNYCRQPPIN